MTDVGLYISTNDVRKNRNFPVLNNLCGHSNIDF